MNTQRPEIRSFAFNQVKSTVALLLLSIALLSALAWGLVASSARAETKDSDGLPRAPQLDDGSAGGVCRIDQCSVLVVNEVEVPALEDGAIMSVFVEPGEFVQKGAALVQINDQQAVLQQSAAEKELVASDARATNNADQRFAQASYDVADKEYQTARELNRIRKRMVPASELRQLELARYRAKLGIEKALLETKLAQLDSDVQQAAVDLAADNVQRRKIVSPLDGIVMPVYRGEDKLQTCQTGNWLRSGEAILRVMRMDRLYVEGRVSAAEYSPAQIHNQPVSVTATMAGGSQAEFRGVVVFISPDVDKRNHYRVRALVENRTDNSHWLLRPGSTAAMNIELR